MRATVIALVCVLLVGGCSSSPTAPDPDPVERVCVTAFCLDIPTGWTGEQTDAFVALHHEVLPDGTFLTANTVNMEAIVQAAGGAWPVPVEEVVRAFWSLLEEAGEGELASTERMVGGAIRSKGTHSTGDMWYLLVPVSGSVGIGVEIRGPNASWESHADAVFPSVVAIP